MTDPIIVTLARALPDFIDGKPTSGGFGKETTAKRMHDALAAEGLVLVSAERLAKLERNLNVDPATLPQPIGEVRRKWWRLGFLSAQAVGRDALAARRGGAAVTHGPIYRIPRCSDGGRHRWQDRNRWGSIPIYQRWCERCGLWERDIRIRVPVSAALDEEDRP